MGAAAYAPLEIPQRVGLRKLLRLRSDTQYADLTGYIAEAQIWNKERTVKYFDIQLTWLHRTIADPKTDWHIELVLSEANSISIPEDAWWDLRLDPPDPDALAFYPLRGPVTNDITYSGDP
jgi:hypothetical protein